VVAGSMSMTNNSGKVTLGGGTITAASLSISGNGSQVISNSLLLGSSTLTLAGNGTTTLAGSNAFTGGHSSRAALPRSDRPASCRRTP